MTTAAVALALSAASSSAVDDLVLRPAPLERLWEVVAVTAIVGIVAATVLRYRDLRDTGVIGVLLPVAVLAAPPVGLAAWAVVRAVSKPAVHARPVPPVPASAVRVGSGTP